MDHQNGKSRYADRGQEWRLSKTAINDRSAGSDRAARSTELSTPLPGLLLVHHDGEPLCLPLPLPPQARPLELGRGRNGLERHIDQGMSRRHARVSYDGRSFFIEDLGSQNGTFVNGLRLDSARAHPSARVLRTGDSLFLFCTDLRPFQAYGIRAEDEMIKGPSLQAAYEQARGAARLGNTLHITGESGAGKEGVARVAHACSAHSAGPFIAVNCATIAESVAERLLFGTRRGAYSGAVSDADGLVQAAQGGTLFLDEIAELPLPVQAKLLRVVEGHEVLPLGANKPVTVQLQLYSATHKNLRAEVSGGRFREDLYFRISRPKISLPPLRQRLEEIPWLIDAALEKLSPQLWAKADLVEVCLLRHWPGNVRELLAEVRTAGITAHAANRSVVETSDLCEDAGRRFSSVLPSSAGADSSAAFSGSMVPALQAAGSPAAAVATSPPAGALSREEIEAALRAEKGNISRTARALGLHRTQLKRFMRRFGMTAAATHEENAD